MEGNSKSQAKLTMAENFSRNKESLMFFEVSEDFLSQLKTEKAISIRDDPVKSQSVVTTSDTTYKIKRNEFSNSLYLCSEWDPSAMKVMSHSQSIFSLQKVVPNKNNVYNFFKAKHQIEEGSDLWSEVQGVSREEVIRSCAISAREFDEIAKDLNLVRTGDNYRFIDERFRVSIFHEILLKWAEIRIAADSDRFDLLSFHRDHFAQTYPFPILESVIRTFCEAAPSEPTQNPSFSITFGNLCGFLSLEILLTKENYFLNEFLEILDKALTLYVPKSLYEGLSAEEVNRLKRRSFQGTAILVDSNNYANTLAQDQRILIQYVNKHRLSFDFTERLQELFSQRKKYFFEELGLWIAPTCLDKAKVSECILKNTRVVYEKLAKNNAAFFRRTYPEYASSLLEDKTNPNAFTIKYYVNKA